MSIRPTSLAAFAADLVAFAGTLAVSAVIGDYRTTDKRLQAENANLRAECNALAAIADDFARQLAMLRHPSTLTADLAACETFEDFEYLTGGSA
jgi:hypothetical protein